MVISIPIRTLADRRPLLAFSQRQKNRVFGRGKEKYIEKDITYNTTLEEIDTIRDRYNASSRELAELARSLSALGKQKIKLKQRLQHPTKDLTKVSEQIFIEA